MSPKKNKLVTHAFLRKAPMIFQPTENKNSLPYHVPEPVGDDRMPAAERFQKAILYGRSAVSDPMKKAAYKKKAGRYQSAFNVAVADFIEAPNIKGVSLAGYSGQPGDRISIEVTDNFVVTKVQVLIENNDGTLVESGYCEKLDEHIWIYTCTTHNSSLQGDKITVTAYDMPDNKTGGIVSL